MLEILLPKDKLARHIFLLWFILSVMALASSGIYSFLPYALRTPFLAKYIDLKHLFNVSLIVHVNLGVLVWFLSCSSMLMVIVTKPIFMPISFTAFVSAMIGSVFISLSPFIGSAEAIKSDYVPILHNLSFILGISLFITGVFLQAILTALSYDKIKNNLINFAIYMNSLIFLMAVICFVQSVYGMREIVQNRFIDLVEYYQLLFWGTGHVLQFCYIQLVIIVWLIISSRNPWQTAASSADRGSYEKLARSPISDAFGASVRDDGGRGSFFILQWLNFMLIIPCVMVYWLHPLDSFELYSFFTLHMKYTGGMLASVMAIWALYNLRIQIFKFETITVYASMFLILSGGVIGYLINGANVTVPAHYHGVILGITAGLMGLFYILLPKLGYRQVNNKHAIWQIMLYSIGQFIHIVALAISGGYGVLRKDPGAVTMKARMFMGAMGIGGSLALIGGIMFVVLVFKNMKEEK